MHNLVFSVGCDDYLYLSSLNGAVTDAKNIFNILCLSEISIYNKNESVLLSSPTLEEFRKSLTTVLVSENCPDILTFFFAGHGGVENGTYFLALKDSKSERLIFSAISLTEILKMISSTNISHLNLIIDACNTAGLVNDLISIVKPEILGEKGTLGISILIAAASNESAGEYNGEGIFTSNLITLINGDRKITTEQEYLDLNILGQELVKIFIEKDIKNQSPTTWSLNLYGTCILVKNLFYNESNSIGLHNFSNIPRLSNIGLKLDSFRNEIWDLFEKLDYITEYSEILFLFQKIFLELTLDEKVLFTKGVGYRFIEKTMYKFDFKSLEVVNILFTLLLPYLNSTEIKLEIIELEKIFQYLIEQNTNNLIQKLEEDKYFLIDKEYMHANYYFLPIRISKLLGVLSQSILIDDSNKANIIKIINLLKENYSEHFRIINDIQSAYLHVFFKIFIENDFEKEIVDIYKSYINNFIFTSGNIAKLNLELKHTFDYIYQKEILGEINIDLISPNPYFGSIMILNSKFFGLDEYINQILHLLDRRDFLIFVPNNYLDFSFEIIEKGENLILKCGLHFWTVLEYEEIYKEKCLKDFSSLNTEDKICCVASSFILPNRIAVML